LSRGSGDGGVGLLVAWRWYDGVVRQRRCMAMVGGGSYRLGYGEHFWGSPENSPKKVFRRGGSGGRRRPAGGQRRLLEMRESTKCVCV
nr:hypothetical protein [Tanacetum cinerariifolium]